jgi:phage terminase large subunit
VKLQFDTRGNEKQKECARYWIDNETEEILYGGAKYGGKSFIGCSLIFGNALIYPETRYFIARDSLTDLRRYTIPSVYEVFEKWGLDYSKYMKYNGQDNYFLLYNKSVIEFIDASYAPSDHQWHRFGSRQYSQGWCEEIGDMHPEAISNLFLTVGRWKNREYNLPKKLLLTCNPHKGYGYQQFYKPFKAGTLPARRKFIVALPADNKAGDPEYINSLLNNPNKNERERLAYGNWEYDDDPTVLIDYEKINDIFTNTHVPEGRKCITADIARLGGDRIVVIEWSGLRCKVRAFEKQKLTVTTTQVEAARVRMGCGKSDVLVDSDGMGSGVEDFGGFKGFTNNARPMPDPKRPVDANGKPVVENFDNLKSQCGFRMAEIINNNGLYLECEDWMKPLIIEELEQVKQKLLDSDMKKGLMPKDKVKEAIGRSPDFWDAILMRIWFELKPKFVSTADAVIPSREQSLPTEKIRLTDR